MERSEVSLHEIKVYLALKDAMGWLTNEEIRAKVGFARRTVSTHTLKLVRLGIIDQAEVFPAHRFRLSDKARKRNVAYVQRLEQACEVFGIKPTTV